MARKMNKYTKRKIERAAGIIFKCIGGSIAFMYIGGLFFVPGLMLFCFLIGGIIGRGVIEPPLSDQLLNYVCIPLCVIFVLSCFGYACYCVGQENK